MRYLFVYDRKVAAVEQLLAELKISDVKVFAVEKRQRAIDPALLREIIDHQIKVALCEVDRDFRRSFGRVDFGFQSKKFRPGDKVLQDWLVPTPPPAVTKPPNPAKSFENISSTGTRVLLADHALDRADEISAHRWMFVQNAAKLLSRLAAGEVLGRREDWKRDFQVPFAGGGKVSFSYRLEGDHGKREVNWHLKEGDRTTPEGAARIYFDERKILDVKHVLVFYVGPHPDNGVYDVNFSAVPCGDVES